MCALPDATDAAGKAVPRQELSRNNRRRGEVRGITRLAQSPV
jgi:hypothetical protein